MAIDPSIFGLRFGSNADITPTQAELDQFLADPKQPGRAAPGRDLERYHALIERVQELEGRSGIGAEAPDIRDRMLYGVVGLTKFASPGLEGAVGQFKYHLSRLAAIDLKKPAVFIRAAEREMAGLDPRKKDQAAKRERLRLLVEQRKEATAVLTKQRAELVKELGNIAQYVRENLARIERVCEASICILVEHHVSKSTETKLIAALKEEFRGKLVDARQWGPVLKQELEDAKRDFHALSGAIADLVREDVYALTSLYEAIHEHAQRCGCAIEGLMARKKAGQDDLARYTEIEGALDALVRDFRFELKAVALRGEPAYENILRVKRREILDHLFTKLERDRRTVRDRRTQGDKRRYATPVSAASERRAGKDRRCGERRRR